MKKLILILTALFVNIAVFAQMVNLFEDSTYQTGYGLAKTSQQIIKRVEMWASANKDFIVKKSVGTSSPLLSSQQTFFADYIAAGLTNIRVHEFEIIRKTNPSISSINFKKIDKDSNVFDLRDITLITKEEKTVGDQICERVMRNFIKEMAYPFVGLLMDTSVQFSKLAPEHFYVIEYEDNILPVPGMYPIILQTGMSHTDKFLQKIAYSYPIGIPISSNFENFMIQNHFSYGSSVLDNISIHMLIRTGEPIVSINLADAGAKDSDMYRVYVNGSVFIDSLFLDNTKVFEIPLIKYIKTDLSIKAVSGGRLHGNSFWVSSPEGKFKKRINLEPIELLAITFYRE